MKYTRGLLFGLFLWTFIFIILSIFMFAPGIKDQVFFQYLILWVLLIPFVLFIAKWYFHTDEPTTKKGVILGVAALVVYIVLDNIVIVPLFIKSYSIYFSNIYLYISMFEVLLLTTYAGYEFDATYTKDTDK